MFMQQQVFRGLVLVCATAVLLTAQEQSSVYKEAMANMETGRPEAAAALLEPWIESHSDDYKAMALLGMALAGTGKSEQAILKFEQALRVRPQYLPALKGLAMSEMNLNRRDSAKTHFEQLLTAAPADPVAHAGLAEIAFGQEKFAEAVQQFDQSGSLYRTDPRLLLDYAKANMQIKQTAKAVDALSGIPGDASAEMHFEAGALLASLAMYDSAARQFELALPKYPDQYTVGYNLVLAQTRGQKYAQAIDSGKKLIAMGYRKAELYNLLSESYEKSGDTKQAYDSLRTATQLDPTDETNYIDLITLCLDHKNYDLASEIAGIGLAKLPSSERLHLQFGVVLAMKAQLSEASKEFETAHKLAPDKSLPHVAVALVLMQTNRPGEAVELLRKRVSQAPDDYLSSWFLGEALNRSGVTPGSAGQKEAVAALQRSVSLKADISQTQELLGKLLVRDGHLDEAQKHLERAVTLEPDNVAAIYQLAQVYSKKGDSVRARQLFAKVSKIKTDDRENFAKHGLQQILRAGMQ
jgi:Flp pilus assembly protein TadD